MKHREITVIAMMMMAVCAMGQDFKLNMEGDDPAQWERTYIDGDVTHHGVLFDYEDLFNPDSVIDIAGEPLGLVDVKDGWISLTSDTAQIAYKFSKLRRKYFWWILDVEHVKEVQSTVDGWLRYDVRFIYQYEDGEKDPMQAHLYTNKSKYKLYFDDGTAVRYFVGNRY